MALRQVRVENFVWNSTLQCFVTTGEIAEGDLSLLEQPAPKRTPSRDRFLKGPVPWHWLVAAAALPGKALVVGLCLWRLSGATKKTTVMLGSEELKPFGVDRAAKSRAISALESAGLITATHKEGRFPIITLIGAHLDSSNRPKNKKCRGQNSN